MSGGVYGGDEVGALVFDIGQYSVKAGFGGEDSPKADIPSTFGVWQDTTNAMSSLTEPKFRYNIGTTSIHVKRNNMEMTNFLKDGMVENWDMFEQLIDYIYTQTLHCVPHHHPVLITEPPWVTHQKRERLAEHMFEKCRIPALYLAKNAAMAAFSNGRPTCMVVDSGATHTSAVPVHDGYVITQAVVKSPVGGDFISMQCRQYLEEQNIEIIPAYMIASKEPVKELEKPRWVRFKNTEVTTSWHNYMVKEIMQDYQNSVLQISDSPYDEEIINTMPMLHYEFPNGYNQDFGSERFKIPEIIFNPTSVKSGLGGILGVGPLVTTSVGMCDIDIRPSLYGSVVVTGGNSNLQGFSERLNRDLAAKTPPSMRLKVISASGPSEKKYGAWLGGSILSSLGAFQQIWVSKQEYEETAFMGVGLKLTNLHQFVFSAECSCV